MKRVLVLLAMVFAFALPAQATEVMGFAPVTGYSVPVGTDDIGGGSSNMPATNDCRCMTASFSDTEESLIMVTNSAESVSIAISGADVIHTNASLPIEVGWAYV